MNNPRRRRPARVVHCLFTALVYREQYANGWEVPMLDILGSAVGVLSVGSLLLMFYYADDFQF